MEMAYLDAKDSTANRYLALIPETRPWKGFLFLIPGFGESPQAVMQQTDLPVLAAQKGILTIVPTFKTGVTAFSVDSLTQASLREMLELVSQKYALQNSAFYIGGFSIGGSCALRYAEWASQANLPHQPKAVFAIDAPLDFERFYQYCKRHIRLSVLTPPGSEAVFMKKRLEELMGGPPETALPNYYEYSPYAFSDTSQTAIRRLLQTPVRLYTEPDVEWWLQERGNDLFGMNALDASCMINELTRLGNKNAQLIATQNKGYRNPDKRRHPHSWSISDAADLIDWLLSRP